MKKKKKEKEDKKKSTTATATTTTTKSQRIMLYHQFCTSTITKTKHPILLTEGCSLSTHLLSVQEPKK